MSRVDCSTESVTTQAFSASSVGDGPVVALPDGLAETVMPFRLLGQGDPLLAFCVKEAMFKAQYPLTRRMLDFSAVPAVIGPARFRGCLGPRLIGGSWGQAVGYYLTISLWRG